MPNSKRCGEFFVWLPVLATVEIDKQTVQVKIGSWSIKKIPIHSIAEVELTAFGVKEVLGMVYRTGQHVRALSVLRLAGGSYIRKTAIRQFFEDLLENMGRRKRRSNCRYKLSPYQRGDGALFSVMLLVPLVIGAGYLLAALSLSYRLSSGGLQLKAGVLAIILAGIVGVAVHRLMRSIGVLRE